MWWFKGLVSPITKSECSSLHSTAQTRLLVLCLGDRSVGRFVPWTVLAYPPVQGTSLDIVHD